MTRKNWNWEEYPMQLINWKVKPAYIADKVAEVEFMLARKTNISVSLREDFAELIKMGIDVIIPAKLTITSKERSEVNMVKEKFGYKNHSGNNAIDYDEVTNDAKVISKEYSITIDEVSGKIHICNDMGESESIIQGIIGGYIAKDKNREGPPGAHFNHDIPQDEGKLRKALFSGFVYLENLPVDLMGEPVTAEQADNKDNQIQLELSEKEKEALEKKNEKKQAKPKEEAVLELPPKDALQVLKKGQLKPPRGSSRTQREVWWGSLRKLYPLCFDNGGNWLGWIDADNGDVDKLANQVMEVADKKADKTKKTEEIQRVPGLLKAVGEGNKMTNMADKNIRRGFILGALVKSKGYSTLSTPTEVGKESGSALIIVNKPRTGKFMLAGLARNESFAKKVQGYDLVDVMTFHAKYFTEDSLVYFVTNAASALRELGAQEKDIVDIVENSA
jgi:hypothetical protein